MLVLDTVVCPCVRNLAGNGLTFVKYLRIVYLYSINIIKMTIDFGTRSQFTKTAMGFLVPISNLSPKHHCVGNAANNLT